MLLYSQDSTPAFELGKLYQNQEMLPLRNSAAVIQTPDTKSCFSKEWHGMISRGTFAIAPAPRFQSHCRMMAAAHHSAVRIGHRRWLWAVQQNSEYSHPRPVNHPHELPRTISCLRALLAPTLQHKWLQHAPKLTQN